MSPILRRLAKRVLTWHLPVPRLLGRLGYLCHVGLRDGGIWLIRVLWWEPLWRSQCTSVGAALEMERLPYLTGAGQIVLGAHVRLSGKSSIGFGCSPTLETPRLVIGDHTFIGHNCAFAIASTLTIGQHCLLAGGVRISDYDGHPEDWQDRRNRVPCTTVRPVTIGEDVWIGANATILKGVTIGDRSIIGTGAVVTRSIPPDSLAAGNPARVIRSLVNSPVGTPRESPARLSL